MSDVAREDMLATAYRQCLHPAGETAQLVLGDLARVCHVGETSFVAGDPLATARNEGQRAVFLYIAGRIGLPLFPGA